MIQTQRKSKVHKGEWENCMGFEGAHKCYRNKGKDNADSVWQGGGCLWILLILYLNNMHTYRSISIHFILIAGRYVLRSSYSSI